MGLKGGQATCAAGKCVVGFDCDADKVFCNALPPLCEGGMTPSVNGGCWGPCVPVSECASIPTCADCTAPGTVCVTVDMQSGDSAASHCVEVPKGCEGSPTCACMGSSVCPAPFSACFDQKQPSGLLCSCPNC
ncbi:MAG: hypothetical protein IPI67_28920 [Myxococcales bacterium]|nr:hypothetical protein [Myxococcales bacterium]